ncbi:Uncharacterised protein [Vibrio cholerae]|nr:Uncharacterised protein [Vibrio cholerae]
MKTHSVKSWSTCTPNMASKSMTQVLLKGLKKRSPSGVKKMISA